MVLIAPIHSFTTQRPQFVDLDRVRVEYFNAKGNINSFLENSQLVTLFLEQLLSGRIIFDLMKI